MSPIPQTSFLVGTFFAASYSYSLIQKNGYTFSSVYSSKCVTVLLNQTLQDSSNNLNRIWLTCSKSRFIQVCVNYGVSFTILFLLIFMELKIKNCFTNIFHTKMAVFCTKPWIMWNLNIASKTKHLKVKVACSQKKLGCQNYWTKWFCLMHTVNFDWFLFGLD